MVHSVQSVQSRAQHVFSLAPQAHIQRASFNRSHGHKTTFDEGYLIPVFLDEVLPGDTFNLSMTALCRMSTPIFPIMDNLYFETFFFFIPNRLVWDNWEEFNGQQTNPNSSTDFLIPTVTSPGGGFAAGTLFDYFGVPTLVAGIPVSALFSRSYAIVYNEWFRDENLQTSAHLDLGDGPDDPANYVLRRRGKRHDYFTSALPWPQKINDGTVVEIPLGTTAPVVAKPRNVELPFLTDGVGTFGEIEYSTAGPGLDAGWSSGAPLDNAPLSFGTLTDPTHTGLYTDLSTATAATINQLRQAFQLQVLFERDARGGTRYTEIIRAHFNVVSPDARLQRPEYLGGGSQMISINPVTQNAPPTAEEGSPQGNLAAFGVGHIQGHGFTKSFTEHGIILGLAMVRADLNYMQGLNRMFSRSTRYDFYWPALAHIGEQTILKKEIYAQGTSVDDEVWAYQERYAEYRYKPSIISGLFRSNATGTLDSWHLAQNFGSLPTLGDTFIVENAPMERVEAVSDEPDFLCDMFFSLKCARPMPLYGDPMQLGRF